VAETRKEPCEVVVVVEAAAKRKTKTKRR